MRPDAEAAIVAAVRSIPRGRVLSYGAVARAAGLPGRARLVGTVLRQTAQDLPWFRVIRANGQLAFPPGSRQFRRQHDLLAAEGIALKSNRVPRRFFGEPTDLDALLWGPGSPD